MKQVYDLQKVGGKAYHLMEMTKAGLPVPSFAVFAFDCFDQADSMDFLASQETAYQSGNLSLDQLSQELLAWAKESFAKEDLSPVLSWAKQTFPSGQVRLAVRSSASIEDGAVSSFAGQFESQLDVPIDHLPQSLEHTFLSLYQVSALAYLFKQGISLPEAQMNCLVQVMIKGDLSGVYFTANPKGILNEHIVVVGQGLGDQIVEDKVPTSMVTYHPADQLSYTEQEPGAPSLTTSQLGDLESLAQQAMALFGPYLDLEFTFQGDRLYILQARPITTLPQGKQIILDNSNIVESYPGLSTPLTISFIQEAYASIFRGLAQRLVGKGAAELAAYEPTFQNMLCPVNSRVYYQIQSWYQLLQLLPFSKKIIPIWQDMLGVRETEVPAMPVHLSPWKRLKIMGRIVREFFTAPKQMAQLEQEFIRIQAVFQERFSPDADLEQLTALVGQLKDEILAHWDITLINDLYAFVYTGLLKKSRQGQDVQAEIAGIEQIESMRPALALQELVGELKDPKNQALRQALENEDAADFLSRQDPLVAKILDFIQEFGDRAPEELKLETPTFRTHPQGLLSLLVQMCQQDAPDLKASSAASNRPRSWWTSFLRRRAMTGVKYRESSRLNRTRIYGMMRMIFRAIGAQLAKQGYIETEEDIFYMTKEEIFELARQPHSVSDLIAERRAKLAGDRTLPNFSRYVFLGQVFEKFVRFSGQARSQLSRAEHLQGIGCSPGRVKGQVLVVDDVQAIESAQGKIMVTRMTDPGWVYLLTQAQGVIAEQGSLLSHTAIISRELGIPSVVNVRGATQLLKSGDWIEMDGLSGQVTILEEADHADH